MKRSLYKICKYCPKNQCNIVTSGMQTCIHCRLKKRSYQQKYKLLRKQNNSLMLTSINSKRIQILPSIKEEEKTPVINISDNKVDLNLFRTRKKILLSSNDFISGSDFIDLNDDDQVQVIYNLNLMQIVGKTHFTTSFEKFKDATQQYNDYYYEDERLKKIFIISDIDNYVFKPNLDINSREYKNGCSICIDNFIYGDYIDDPDMEPVKRPHCRHIFHKGCIDKWNLIKTTCPLCRF